MATFAGFINGDDDSQIWLDDVVCVGTEALLASCPHPGFGIHNCAHIEDAGVTCQPFVRKSLAILALVRA